MYIVYNVLIHKSYFINWLKNSNTCNNISNSNRSISNEATL